jgi:predicted DNA-binding protein (UPF0251 family)/predicted Fe-Mo cluster-binding NifX family protein
MRQLKEVHLPLEGYEALRLADVSGLKQDEAAARMNISRQTFGRILASAHQVVADALVQGMALRIQSGENDIAGEDDSRVILQPANRSIAAAATGAAKEPQMNKIAISCEGPDLDDRVDPRFGRAAGFLVVDRDTMETEYIDNGSSQVMSQGAGIQAAQTVAATGAAIVLTGYVGPKAFRALEAAGIKVGQNLENMTARQALDQYLNDQVAVASKPNKEGHWK